MHMDESEQARFIFGWFTYALLLGSLATYFGVALDCCIEHQGLLFPAHVKSGLRAASAG